MNFTSPQERLQNSVERDERTVRQNKQVKIFRDGVCMSMNSAEQQFAETKTSGENLIRPHPP